MEKGFTLKSIVIILAGIILMASIAFFVQRNGEESETKDLKDPVVEKEEEIYDEVEEDKKEDETIDNDISEIENEEEKEDENEIIDEEDKKEEENKIVEDVDCGDANYLAVKAKKDLSEMLDINIDEIRIESCQEHIFSDHTLGTSGPGEVYPQEETKGYIIYLNFNEQVYRYHGSGNTLFYKGF